MLWSHVLKKTAEFTAMDLAIFIDKKFYEITKSVKSSDKLIRTPESCRIDLRRWGVRFKQNSQRPYFEGHERNDVVVHRKEFVSHLLANKENYYTVSQGEDLKCNKASVCINFS